MRLRASENSTGLLDVSSPMAFPLPAPPGAGVVVAGGFYEIWGKWGYMGFCVVRFVSPTTLKTNLLAHKTCGRKVGTLTPPFAQASALLYVIPFFKPLPSDQVCRQPRSPFLFAQPKKIGLSQNPPRRLDSWQRSLHALEAACPSPSRSGGAVCPSVRPSVYPGQGSRGYLRRQGEPVDGHLQLHRKLLARAVLSLCYCNSAATDPDRAMHRTLMFRHSQFLNEALCRSCCNRF